MALTTGSPIALRPAHGSSRPSTGEEMRAPIEPGGCGHNEEYRGDSTVASMEGGPQREGPVHLYPFNHGQEQRDLTLGTAAQERLSAEGNILLQNLQRGEGRTGISKPKGEAVRLVLQRSSQIKTNPTNKELTLHSGDEYGSAPNAETSASQPLSARAGVDSRKTWLKRFEKLNQVSERSKEQWLHKHTHVLLSSCSAQPPDPA